MQVLLVLLGVQDCKFIDLEKLFRYHFGHKNGDQIAFILKYQKIENLISILLFLSIYKLKKELNKIF
jgi:hypothetical protein